MLHLSCHEAMKEKLAKCGELIVHLSRRNEELREQVRQADSVFYKLRRIFTGVAINVETCRREIDENENILEKLTEKQKELNKIIISLYDYWPTYPPDWEERKVSARNRIGFCERCFKSHIILHVHHKVHISRGGNHKLENLEVLCEDHHSSAHGGRKFDYKGRNSESSFAKKLKTLRNAIASEAMIRFSYTRRDGQKSVRTVIPEKFKRIKSSLCIHGYCYLRNEPRTFAIKRMMNLRGAEEPGKQSFLS